MLPYRGTSVTVDGCGRRERHPHRPRVGRAARYACRARGRECDYGGGHNRRLGSHRPQRQFVAGLAAAQLCDALRCAVPCGLRRAALRQARDRAQRISSRKDRRSYLRRLHRRCRGLRRIFALRGLREGSARRPQRGRPDRRVRGRDGAMSTVPCCCRAPVTDWISSSTVSSPRSSWRSTWGLWCVPRRF